MHVNKKVKVKRKDSVSTLMDVNQYPAEWKDPSFYCNSPEYEFEVIQRADTRGGIPIIKGTRLGVYDVAAMAEKNSIDRILEGYPSLNRDMIEKSIVHAKNNPPFTHA